jgi:hypothetical protein
MFPVGGTDLILPKYYNNGIKKWGVLRGGDKGD